jgi:hypothetical protein
MSSKVETAAKLKPQANQL